jgi:hypothetical protein
VSQAKLKQLGKLLKEWAKEFDVRVNVGTTHSEEQPMYAEIVRTVMRQVEREVE